MLKSDWGHPTSNGRARADFGVLDDGPRLEFPGNNDSAGGLFDRGKVLQYRLRAYSFEIPINDETWKGRLVLAEVLFKMRAITTEKERISSHARRDSLNADAELLLEAAH
jgi:hypothetical protein